MTITFYPSPVRDGSPALIVFSGGTPDRVVKWSLAGTGTLTPISTCTDRNGQAAARFVPAGVGTVTFTVECGA